MHYPDDTLITKYGRQFNLHNQDEVPNLYSAFLLGSFKVIYMLNGKRRELEMQEIHSRKNKVLFEKCLAVSQKISTMFLVHLMNSCILHFSLYLWEVIA